jgi:hypothetical protein
MKNVISAFLFVVCALSCGPVYGWLRGWHEDAVMVQRSELIVIGHLERGSIVDDHPGAGFTRYHGNLVITQVLKGTVEVPAINVIIYYGLTPLVGGHIDDDQMKLDLRPLLGGLRDDAILILDTGSSAISFSPLVPDAGENNVWFLRRRSGNYGREPGTGDFGIVDPQDLRPLSSKDYFLAYLSADPETAVRIQMVLHPEVARGAQRYLDHLEVERILRMPDPNERVERLIPYYVKGQSWASEGKSRVDNARQGIIECGTLSGERLMKLFDDSEPEWLRGDVIRVFGEIRFQGGVDRVIELLKQHDKFWSRQVLEKNWWGNQYGSALTTARQRNYGEVLDSVIALGEIGDPRAINAIELTKRRWQALDFEDPQIVEACDKTLTELRRHRGITNGTVVPRRPNN